VAFDSIAAYIRRRQRYVGLAKAGWVVAFQRARVAVRRYTLSGGRSAAPKDVPAWVKPRNFGRAARVGMSKDTLKFGRRGFFLATNASPWARYPTTVRRSISWVIRKRLRSMENETAFLAARSARAAKFSVPKTVRAASMPASIF